MTTIRMLIDDEEFTQLSDEEKIKVLKEVAAQTPDDVDKVYISWLERLSDA